MYRKAGDVPEMRSEPDPTERVHQTLKLTDQYLALLVLVLTHAGLSDVSLSPIALKLTLTEHSAPQALTSMLEESTTGSNLSRKATLLMAEVLQMANRVLPLSVAAKIQVRYYFVD